LQQNAADVVVRSGAGLDAAVLLDSPPHFGFGLRPVLLPVGSPCETRRENGVVTEEAAADDEVVGAVELEQERLTG